MPKDARVCSLTLAVRLQSVAVKMALVVVMAEEALAPPNAANPNTPTALVPVTVRLVADATKEVSVALMAPPNEEAKPMHTTLLDPAVMTLQFDAVMEVPTAENA